MFSAFRELVAISGRETKNADFKVRLIWIIDQVSSEFQSRRYSSAVARLPTNLAWDFSGMPVVTNSPGGYFRASVSNVTPPNTSNYPTDCIALLQVQTRWPSRQLTSTNVSVISLFNYQ